MLLSIIVLSILTIFNITMWIVFGIRFKKVFSTDDVIKRTRESLNRMLIDINRNAERNISLIDERINKLKAASAEADRHLIFVEKELEKIHSSTQLQRTLDDIVPVTTISFDQIGNVHPAQGYLNEQKHPVVIETENVAEESSEPKYRQSAELQKIREEEKKAAMQKGVPEFTVSANPIVPKKNINIVIKELYDRGDTPESIATSLGISVQEVNFSLEFSND